MSWQKSDCLKYFDKKTKVNKLKVNYARKRKKISRRVKFLLKKYYFFLFEGKGGVHCLGKSQIV